MAVNLKNTIVNGISPLTVVGDLDQFGSLVTRGPADPAFPGLPGRITEINQLFINLGATKIQGLDIEGHDRTPAQSWGRLSFNLAGTYYLRYDAQNADGSYTDQQTDLNNLPRTVGSLSLWDLRGTYSGFKNLKLTLGVRNLFDRDPPKSNQQSTFILGFDPSYYDPRGRFLYTSVTHTFKWRTNAGRGSAQLRGAPNLRSGRGATPRNGRL